MLSKVNRGPDLQAHFVQARHGVGMPEVNTSQQFACYIMGQSALDRYAYRRVLEQDLGCSVVTDSDFAPTSVWAAMRHKPDFVLADADVPRSEVVDALQMIARLHPEVRVAVLSNALSPAQVEPWCGCPMHAYVLKDGGFDELRGAVTALCNGREYFSDGIQDAMSRAASRERGTSKLSRRESDLLPLLARGMTLREAAARLSISYKTADSYRTSLLRKLGVRDRVELARYAIRLRIVDP